MNKQAITDMIFSFAKAYTNTKENNRYINMATNICLILAKDNICEPPEGWELINGEWKKNE